MKAAVLTAVYDNYDPLKPFPVQDVEVETICVTDNPNLEGDGWKRIVYEPREGVHPNRAAKTPKMCPWRYTDADLTIWIDASFRVQSAFFVEDMCAYTFGQMVHPDRDCIFQEANVSLGMEKYAREPIAEQIARYDHPQHWGLWATGLIVRRHSPEIEKFGEAWLQECWDWSFQDQISEAPMLREYGLRPETIPGFYHQNPWLAYEGSGRH